MIILCEPNCRRISHETFNLGMIYGVALAYPKEEIVVFLDKTHRDVLEKNIANKKLSLQNVKFVTINTYVQQDGINKHYNRWLLGKVFDYAMRNAASAIYMLSATQLQQRIIKDFAARHNNINFAINMHGEFDNLAFPNFQRISGVIPSKTRSFKEKLLLHRGEMFSLVYGKIKRKIIATLKMLLLKAYPKYDLLETMYYKATDNVRYVALSEHVRPLIDKYVDTRKVRVEFLPLPAVYRAIPKVIKNDKLKIAVFGYGHSQMLYLLNQEIANRGIKSPFEIRIIGMDGTGIEGFPWMTWPIQSVLTREQMEELQKDIDMFVILYEKERYVLTCSGSIIEAHDYCKPILYLDNPCMNGFNLSDSPIGIGCHDVEEMSHVIANMADNYGEFLVKLAQYRNNIITNRGKIDIRNHAHTLHKILD